jgi:orotate phosphoribosyltransferase-like protein
VKERWTRVGKRLLCTPATVGVLKERGLSLAEISRKLHVAASTVHRYWIEWSEADERARKVARKSLCEGFYGHAL